MSQRYNFSPNKERKQPFFSMSQHLHPHHRLGVDQFQRLHHLGGTFLVLLEMGGLDVALVGLLVGIDFQDVGFAGVCLLLQFQTVLESFTNTLRDLIIAVRVRVESDGLQGFHIHFAVLHLAGLDRGLQHLSDDAKACVVALVFNEFTLHGDRQLVDDGSVYQ